MSQLKSIFYSLALYQGLISLVFGGPVKHKLRNGWILTRDMKLEEEAKNCFFPNQTLDNGWFIYESPDDVRLSMAPESYLLQFQCEKGYQRTNPYVISCIKGKWTADFPKCIKLYCEDPPTIENGYFELLKGRNPIIGSIANYSCNEGFEFVDTKTNAVLFCVLNGSNAVWTGQIPQCKEKETCSDPGIPPDGYRSNNCCFSGHVVRFSCKANFELIGEKNIICLPGGVWNSSRPRCRPRNGFCPDPPNIPSGIVKLASGRKRGDFYTANEEVEIVCDPGFAFDGESEFILCEETSEWEMEFGKCRETSCMLPELPENGSIPEIENTNVTEFQYKFEITYVCNKGFRLIGQKTRCCDSKGWSGKSPRCEAVKCYNPGVPENGRRIGNNFSVGEKVVFSCYPEFTLIGSTERYCLSNGQWSGDLARCNHQSYFCPDPGIPINGMKIGHRYEEDENVTFRCQGGFFLVGSAERKCLPNRTWSGIEPKCIGPYDYDNIKEVSEILNEAIISKAKEQEEELNKRTQSFEEFKQARIAENGNDFNPLQQARILNLNYAGRFILYFVFDVSGSVKERNFKISINFAKMLVKKVGITDEGARVGAVTFSSKAEIKFLPLQHRTTEDVLDALDKINYTSGGTATNSALKIVRKEMIPLTRARLGGKGMKSVIFILTDGKSNTGGDPEHQAKLLSDAEVEIYCIGITGSIRKEGLYKIASEPLDEHVFVLKDYDSLSWLIEAITKGAIDYSKCGVGLRSVHTQRSRIIGGKKANQPWPWMAALYLSIDKYRDPTEAELKCGGSIIGKQWILTAAHCLFNKGEQNERTVGEVTIKLGLTDVENFTNLQEYEASKFFVHPEFDNLKNLDYDIAIIQLNRPIEFTRYVRPICLPQADLPEGTKLYKPGENAFATGWGYDKTLKKDEQVETKALRDLKELLLPIQSRDRCRISLNGSSERYFTERMFCAGSGKGNEDTCQGDSGGPLMQSQFDKDNDIFWTQVGIVSWGVGCGLKNLYGFYTHIHNLLPWVQLVLNSEQT